MNTTQTLTQIVTQSEFISPHFFAFLVLVGYFILHGIIKYSILNYSDKILLENSTDRIVATIMDFQVILMVPTTIVLILLSYIAYPWIVFYFV